MSADGSEQDGDGGLAVSPGVARRMAERAKVLFVCSGNTCRSPIAEYILRHELERCGLADAYEVHSAGTLGIENAPATDEALTVLDERGIDARGHRSQGLTRELVEDARVIIGMTVAHVAAVEHLAPDAASRCHVVTEFSPGDPSRGVDDPIGQPVGEYQRCAEAIEDAMPGIISFLNRERGGETG